MRAAMPAPDLSALAQSPGFEIVALVVGLAVGSFANVCIHRLTIDFEPAGGRLGWLRDIGRQLRSLLDPPSHCPRCQRAIRPWDNVPILSWLLLRARCRDCGLPISPRYPAVELLNGLLWLGLALRQGPRPETVVQMVLASALLVLLLTDLEHFLLPDAITIPFTWAGIGLSFVPGWHLRPVAAIGAAAGGYLVFWALASAWRRWRGIEALGEGDWKLAAMLGAFLGWDSLLLTLVLASAAGSLFGVAVILARRGSLQSRLPFGTFIAAAAILVLFVGRSWLAWYAGALRG
jgi:leader peptidase (prepilin peptidase) / N-methyltransferase